MSSGDEAHRAAERAARSSYGRLVAFLAARTRDVAAAEDALAEAFAAAVRSWPVEGVPANPDAWLLTVARRRQLDDFRRRQTRTSGEAHLQLMADEMEEASRSGDAVPDRRLALMFACAHPAIDRGLRAPLILQTILGFSAEQIAAAFLIPPATMGQRLVRAKLRLKQAGIPFAIPEREELDARLDAVLEAIYAAYGRGWSEVEGGTPGELAGEAIWLGRLVVSLLPRQPEAKGMLALMLFAEARRPARRDPSGGYVPLDEQDTSLWDTAAIAAAEALLAGANAEGPSGRYQLEAAIQSAHVVRRRHRIDTWPAIVALYDHLLALTQSPVVALNRAVAVAERDGPTVALPLLDAMATDPRLAGYQPYWAARAALLTRAGRRGEAREAFTVAIGLSTDDAVKRYLAQRRDTLGKPD